MITITVKGLADIGKIIGFRGEIELTLPPGSTLYDLLAALTEKLGQKFHQRVIKDDGTPISVREDVRLLLNGRDIAFLKGLATVLNEKDKISLIPPLAGG
ncbi:MoaD/ThiS family protein [Candidatus Contubernalis alkaliaceticus]|uniref:MoaD/ThiS family protein n=1 Tax=Candidatus Contubernalis alkaliaceticus TaxID=338645 RepID=UPI001F4C2F3C|nr:MoaD/ThiS family protein [Candidatus Contubernalis alkalaceticus]UNC91552.1 MoaD/ThiS family protein [Candidatus Contubernalis alkalaceticus]